MKLSLRKEQKHLSRKCRMQSLFFLITEKHHSDELCLYKSPLCAQQLKLQVDQVFPKMQKKSVGKHRFNLYFQGNIFFDISFDVFNRRGLATGCVYQVPSLLSKVKRQTNDFITSPFPFFLVTENHKIQLRKPFNDIDLNQCLNEIPGL